jgi:hypothetical protein
VITYNGRRINTVGDLMDYVRHHQPSMGLTFVISQAVKALGLAETEVLTELNLIALISNLTETHHMPLLALGETSPKVDLLSQATLKTAAEALAFARLKPPPPAGVHREAIEFLEEMKQRLAPVEPTE